MAHAIRGILVRMRDFVSLFDTAFFHFTFAFLGILLCTFSVIAFTSQFIEQPQTATAHEVAQ
jgi:hypothetical protein